LWTYFAGLAIYVLYNLSAILLDSPMFTASSPLTRDELKLASLLDPFAVSAFLEQTQFWTSLEKNSTLVKLEGTLLLNRLIWFLVSCLLLTVTLYRRATPNKFHKRNQKKSKVEPKSSEFIISTDGQALSANISSWQRNWMSFKFDLLLELKTTFRSIPFMLLMTLVGILVLAQLVNSLNMGSLIGSQHPYTSLILPNIVSSLELVGMLIVVLYSGELVWRARETNFEEILRATPTSSLTYLMSKICVLCLLILSMLIVSIFVALVYQHLRGFTPDNISLYLTLIPIYCLPLLMLGVLCLFIQTLVSNKFVGILVSAILLTVLTTSFGAQYLDIEHNLLRFSRTGTIRYSDFNGFGHYKRNIFWFSLYWSLITVIIAQLTYLFLKKGNDESIFGFVSNLPKYLSRKTSILLVLFSSLSIVCGGFIYFNTNILNVYKTKESVINLQVEYERTFSHYRLQSEPKITDIFTHVHFFPNQLGIKIEGHYWLENKSNTAIDTILIGAPNYEQHLKLELEAPHQLNINHRLNAYEINLASPMKPGERLKLDFFTSLYQKGFKNHEPNISIIENGSYFHSESLFPYVGYQTSFETREQLIRKQYDLGQQVNDKPLIEGKIHDEHYLEKDADWINFETIVSTSAEQTAIAPGEFQKQWFKNGRNYFQYRTTSKIANFQAFSSAKYQILTKQHEDVTLRFYYHLDHDKNIDQLVRATIASLDYYKTQFGQYPYSELKLAEIPYRNFARAYPATIFISENVGFKEDLRDKAELDDFSNVIAHEIAHQWWAHQMTAAKTQGATLLTESLADYSALMVMKQLYGESYLKKLIARSMQKYLKGRSGDTDAESSLHKMTGQHYLRYEKGPIVLNAIRHLIGEERLNKALNQLLTEKAHVTSNYATSLDLIAHIKNHTSALESILVDEWLTQIAIYDLSITLRDSILTPSNKYKVSFELTGSTFIFDDNSQLQEVPFEHKVPVIVFGSGSEQSRVLHQTSIHLKKGKQQVTLLLNSKPGLVILDPNMMFIDRNRKDNQIVIN
jgi:ABC-2 type transport system permease protein